MRLDDHFWTKVDKDGPVARDGLAPCWTWKGFKSKDGYGTYTVQAHRASYMLTNGEIPEGKLVLHSCDTPSCVNPDHLRPGTHKENAEDRVERGRSENPGRPPVIDLEQLDEIVKFKAQGVSDRKLADLYKVSPQTIARHLKSPYGQEKLSVWREVIRSVVLRRTAEGTASAVFDVIDLAARDNDAKGVDAASRAAMNLEKTAASASGEARKMEMTGKDGAPLAIDVRALIKQIVDHNA